MEREGQEEKEEEEEEQEETESIVRQDPQKEIKNERD